MNARTAQVGSTRYGWGAPLMRSSHAHRDCGLDKRLPARAKWNGIYRRGASNRTVKILRILERQPHLAIEGLTAIGAASGSLGPIEKTRYVIGANKRFAHDFPRPSDSTISKHSC